MVRNMHCIVGHYYNIIACTTNTSRVVSMDIFERLYLAPSVNDCVGIYRDHYQTN